MNPSDRIENRRALLKLSKEHCGAVVGAEPASSRQSKILYYDRFLRNLDGLERVNLTGLQELCREISLDPFVVLYGEAAAFSQVLSLSDDVCMVSHFGELSQLTDEIHLPQLNGTRVPLPCYHGDVRGHVFALTADVITDSDIQPSELIYISTSYDELRLDTGIYLLRRKDGSYTLGAGTADHQTAGKVIRRHICTDHM